MEHNNYNKILNVGELKKYLQNVPDNAEIICDTHDKNIFATRGYMNDEQYSWVNHVEDSKFNTAALYIHADVPDGLEKCRFCSAPANTINVSAFTGMTADEGVGSIDINIPHVFVDAEECCDYFSRYSDNVSMVSYDEISYTVSVPFGAVRAAAAKAPNCMWLKDICEKVIDNIKDGTGDVDFQFGAPFPEDNGGTTLARIPYPVGTKCKYRKSSCDEWKDGEIYAYIIGKNNRITKVEIADFEMFEIAGIEIPNATVYDWGMDFDSNVSVLL